MATTPTSDVRSHGPMQVENAARLLRKAPKLRAVFSAIYFGSKQSKTVEDIQLATGIKNTNQVLNLIKKLHANDLIDRRKVGGKFVCYKITTISDKKDQILKLSENKKGLEKFKAENRGFSGPANRIIINFPKHLKPQAIQLTIDDIDSFEKVRKIPLESEGLLEPISERKFNNGIRKILGGPWEQKDWGGEDDDLSITNLKFKTKRIATAFAFKGPATKSPLVLKKMGKNGDQILRLFKNDMELYVLQFQGEIDPHMTQEMNVHARGRSGYAGTPVYYMIINGQDSSRLRKAYPKFFN